MITLLIDVALFIIIISAARWPLYGQLSWTRLAELSLRMSLLPGYLSLHSIHPLLPPCDLINSHIVTSSFSQSEDSKQLSKKGNHCKMEFSCSLQIEFLGRFIEWKKDVGWVSLGKKWMPMGALINMLKIGLSEVPKPYGTSLEIDSFVIFSEWLKWNPEAVKCFNGSTHPDMTSGLILESCFLPSFLQRLRLLTGHGTLFSIHFILSLSYKAKWSASPKQLHLISRLCRAELAGPSVHVWGLGAVCTGSYDHSFFVHGKVQLLPSSGTE